MLQLTVALRGHQKYKLAANTTKHQGQQCTRGSLHVESLTVSFDLHLCFFHFLEQLCVSDDTSRVPHFPTRLVQTRDNPHDRTLRDIRQFSDLLERLSKQMDQFHVSRRGTQLDSGCTPPKP